MLDLFPLQVLGVFIVNSCYCKSCETRYHVSIKIVAIIVIYTYDIYVYI